MKTINYTLIIFLVCLTLNSCQDMEDPVNTVPTVTTDSVKEYSGNFAYLTGVVSSKAQCYFLLSTSKDLRDAQKVEARGSVPNYSAEIGNLIPGTTYYYTLCATDGRSEVRSSVRSFTTTSYLSIDSVTTTTVYGEITEEVVFDGTSIGVFILYDNTYELYYGEYGNLYVTNHKGAWNWDYKIPINYNALKIYAYYPYNERLGRYNWKEIPVTPYQDFLYGSSETINKNHPNANIKIKHASALLTFSITKSENSSVNDVVKAVRIRNVKINGQRTKAITRNGYINIVTGVFTSTDDYTHDGIYTECEFVPSTDKAHTVEVMVLPSSFNEGEAIVELSLSNGYILYTTFSETNWESGKHYTYPLEIGLSDLYIGNVRVEEWNNNEGGTIIVNK